MVQQAKFIDVTRTYVPIDPNTFPETMHGTGKEDYPENKIPVVAYDGHNFMPTQYGYRSYFGTNGKAQFSALGARVDYIFMFQTQTFENLLIALCETGIWIKNGATTGAWTQAVTHPLPLDLGAHYEWSYAIISDVLYAYKQNSLQYYTITSLATAPYYTVTPVTPTFLNMVAQMRVFKAGGRLGFFDSADSVSWSSLDNLADFVPSLETLAGNSIFSDVNGRIVTIEGCGEGFIIYATKSIVYIRNNNDATYQWDPTVLISNSGIAYPEEVTVAIPDTRQFAYTNTGIYNIETNSAAGKAEIIIPEVYDFLKKAQKPIYPRIVEGRFLFLQILEQGFFNGLGTFTDEAVPGVQYFFPGNKTIAEAAEDTVLTGTSMCGVYNAAGNGAFDEQQALANSIIPDKKPGTTAKPIWKCWISNSSVLNPDDLTFGPTPCSISDANGVSVAMSPVGKSGRLDALTQDATNKTGLLGSDVYVDGIWTIERFIAVQTAIWKKQDETLAALIDKICSKNSITAKVEDLIQNQGYWCDPVAGSRTECAIGSYVAQYSGAQFGMRACSFWLTRYAIAAVGIYTVRSANVTCDLIPDTADNSVRSYSQWGSYNHGNSPYFATADAVCKYYSGGTLGTEVGAATVESYCHTPGTCSGGDYAIRDTTCGTGWPKYSVIIDNMPVGTYGPCSARDSHCQRNAYYHKVTNVFAYNEARYVDITPTPDVGYCEIVGWTYTATDNTTKTIASSSCVSPTSYPAGSPVNLSPLPRDVESTNTPISMGNGSICSIPFEPITIPGTPPTLVDWPDTTVELPPSSFLFQKGSIAPVYPTFEGAYVYDLHLKKWGNFKSLYKRLLDYQPLNDYAGGGIPYNRFGILGGVFRSDGFVYVFDAQPEDSVIKYGKVGYYRLGYTSSEEVKIHFASNCTGTLTLEASENGRNLAAGWTKSQDYENANSVQMNGGPSGRWFNICIAGIYDIQYIEYRGFAQTRR